jgi:ribosome-associated protein
LRRQRQLIGKLMRKADADAIQASLDKLRMQDGRARETFREAERWRDRITAEGAAALSEFTARTGDLDTESDTGLEQLLRELDAAGIEPAKRRVRRRIFRELYKRLDASRGTGDQ